MIVNSIANTVLFALTLGSYEVAAVGPPIYAADLAGKYCEARRSHKCCTGREDDCSAPILGTLCYCDDFCNRTKSDDCCPDYWTYCKGLTIALPLIAPTCEKNGRFYNEGETVKLNCNTCKCQRMNDGQMELLCETKQCLVDEDLIEHVNRNHRHFGWRASNYSTFWGRYYDEGLTHRLGTFHSNKLALPLRPVYDPASLPHVFDARTAWPGMITEPQDQGWCGASWAFSTAAVASDRFSIALKRLHWKNRDEKISLSSQHLVSCNTRQRGCQGGHVTRAWNFIRKFGLVPESCYPWDQNARSTCRIKKFSSSTEATCPAVKLYGRGPPKAELYRVGPAYRLSGEEDIMYEIVRSGPLQATMRISREFFSYKNGIYQCSSLSRNDRSAYHSIRILGWGEEIQNNQLVKYWIASNSWGDWWGERGYFRIRRGVNECQVEDVVLAAWANIESLNKDTKEQTQAFMEYDAQPMDINNQI